MRGLATKSTIAATDLLSVAAAMIAVFFLWSHWRIDDPRNFRNAHEWLGVLSMPIWLFAISHAGLYRSRLITSRMEEVRRVGRATISAMLGVAALSSVTRFEAARLWLVLSAVFAYAALVTNRTIIRRRFQRQRRAGARLRGVVIVGTNSEALAIARSLRDDPALGYRVAGFTSDDLPPGYSFDGLGEVFGSISQTLSAVRRTNSTGALIATTAVNHDESMKLTSGLAEAGVHVELSSALRDIATRRMTIRPVGRYPIVYVEPQLRGSWRGIGKRAFDVGFATVGLLITAPVLLLAVLAIKFDGGGPVLFTQRRVGRGGVSFELRKLRTMVPDAEARLREVIERNEASWPLFKMKNDPRVTRVGQFLRRTSIDELPQLWNVLRGEMSIVGPRPAIASEADGWTPEMHARLKVRPGITGMWQVNGRSTATTEDYERLDLYYVNNWSFMSDMAIIARTIPAVLATRGAY